MGLRKFYKGGSDPKSSSREQASRMHFQRYWMPRGIEASTVNATTTADSLPPYTLDGNPGQDYHHIISTTSPKDTSHPFALKYPFSNPSHPILETYTSVENLPQSDLEEDIERIKQETRATRRETLHSTRNMIQLSTDAMLSADKSLDVMRQQGEQMGDMEGCFSRLNANTFASKGHIKQMERYTGGMVAPFVPNPFTSSRRRKQEAKLIQQHEEGTKQRREKYKDPGSPSRVKMELINQGKGKGYFEDIIPLPFGRYIEIEDIPVEREINRNLGTIGELVGNLKTRATTISRTIDRQNVLLRVIEDDTEAVSNCIEVNNQALDRLSR
ncbi:hypothetical protein BABINDRAFT_161202 [Babjeviella inositovora NRRL Y-12698]|uniref:t-SNARE coiled-coil homology domain-containing protein n=1 Tax=Babjeviella inositovora NRRL Y-12698 TaxID=984486 RepID=A0A1E3QRC2_9ASCO|nr:uncharacterized protein BABINDRAFT_161202 [Babjeviella inositovora NRRL Y-12698]ODQ80231.1 hypothetical protein BABINDRAFT_161202 [Babjeviella inositovora NRRL Y-12698]